MIIDLKKIRISGKQESGFYFEYDLSESLSDIPSSEILNPIKISGTTYLTGMHSAYIEGEIAFTLKGECTRCLTEVENLFVVDFNEQVEENNPDGYSVVCDKVDLKKIVEDRIVLSLPMNFLCKDDCRGICVGCGVNLNQEECKCKK